MDNDYYIRKWEVPSFTNPDKIYTVSLTKNGEYQCSCPQWIFRRKECKHIKMIRERENIEIIKPKPIIIVNKTPIPKFSVSTEDQRLLSLLDEL